MNYYQNLHQKKVPVPLALLALTLIVFIIPLSLRKTSPTSTKASQITYDSLEVSNLTYQSANITVHTTDQLSMWILYGTSQNNLNQTAFDERDLSDTKGKYHYHYITFSNLDQSKTYYYKIITDKGILGNNKSFSFTTANQFGLINNLGPSFGKIVNSNGSPSSAIVFVNIENALPLSSRTKETTGEFLIPTYYLLKSPTEAYNPKSDTPVTFTIINEAGLTSHVKTTFSKMGPLAQTVILGKDYDFTTQGDNVLGASSAVTSTPVNAPVKKIDIIFPTNNAQIPGDKPLYKGTAIPGSKILITLKPSIYSLQTTTNKDGVWTISSTNALPPGSYLMTVNTVDAANKAVTLSRNFSIAKSGEDVLGAATGSATLTPSPTPTLTVLPTNAPTVTPLPTIIATTITPVPTLPVTGVSFMSLTVASLALIVLGAGIIMIF